MIDDATIQDHFDLVRGEIVPGFYCRAVASEPDALAALQASPQLRRLQNVACFQSIIVRRVDEPKRKHAIVDQVLPMDAGEGLRDHDPEPETAGSGGGMFSRRTLPVVSSADNSVSSRAMSGGAARVSRIDARE